MPRAGTGRDSLSQSGTGRGTRQSPIFCQNPGRDRDGTGQSLIFPTIFCFRTSFSCLRTSFSCFFVSLGRWFCPGTFRDRGFCPGTFAPALARDKGTPGHEFFFVPGQRDNGRSPPGLSRDFPRDVLSLGNTSSSPGGQLNCRLPDLCTYRAGPMEHVREVTSHCPFPLTVVGDQFTFFLLFVDYQWARFIHVPTRFCRFNIDYNVQRIWANIG